MCVLNFLTNHNYTMKIIWFRWTFMNDIKWMIIFIIINLVLTEHASGKKWKSFKEIQPISYYYIHNDGNKYNINITRIQNSNRGYFVSIQNQCHRIFSA